MVLPSISVHFPLTAVTKLLAHPPCKLLWGQWMWLGSKERKSEGRRSEAKRSLKKTVKLIVHQPLGIRGKSLPFGEKPGYPV